MATAYTSLLGLALPVTGELAGTWGDTVNNSITSLLDSAVSGTTTLSTDADVTLTTTTGASNQARQAILLCSGARTVLRTITAPAQSKLYVVINSTTGGFGVKLVGVGPTTGVTVAAGKTAVVVWNGSDFVEVAPAVATNLSGGVAGSLPYQTAASTTTFLGIGAANYVLTSTGTAPTWTLNTGTGSVVRATSPTITTPTITTSATVPLLIGGTATTSTLTLRSTSGVGTTGADIIFQTGNNGATEAMRVLNSGNVGIGTNAPSQKLTIGAGDLQIDNAQYFRGKIAAGTTTRMLGINASNLLYVGSVDAALSGITFNVNGTTYGGFDASGNVNFTGNTTLGDATTDTVTVNGYVGVGITPSANVGVFTRPSALTTTSQYGVLGGVLANSAATALAVGVMGEGRTAATAFTVSDLVALYANNCNRGAGSTITNQHGVYIDDQTQGTNNYGITSLVSSGTNKWNIYASGTAQNYFAGNVLLNTTTGMTTWTNGGQARLQVANNNTYGALSALSFGTANPAFSGMLVLGKSRGAIGTATETNNNDALGFISFEGVNTNSTFIAGAYLRATQTGAAGATNIPAAIQFFTSSGTSDPTEHLRITSSGNVGIGTSSPGALLHLNANNAALRLSEAGTYYGSIQVDSAGGLTIASDPTNVAANSRLIFGVDGTERLRIDSAGNVGIGTATPSLKLDVVGATNNGTITQVAIFRQISTQSAGSGAEIVLSANEITRAVALAGVVDTGNGHAMLFKTSTSGATPTERMRITSAGLVGIGTTTPGQKLDVYAGNGVIRSSIGGTTFGVQAIETPTAADQRLGLLGFGSDTDTFKARVSGYSSAAWTAGTSTPAYLAFHTTPTASVTATERMRIDSVGNMGVGTTSPASYGKLAVVGTIASLTADTANIGSLATSAGVTSLSAYNATGAALTFNTATTGGVNTERMRITSAGAMLIGTAAQTVSETVSIVGNTNTSSSGTYPCLITAIDSRAYNSTAPSPGGGITFGYKYNVGGSTTLGPSIQGFKENTTDGDFAGALKFLTRANGASPAEAMRITSAGNVGIGTAAPSQLLHIASGDATALIENTAATSNATLQLKYPSRTWSLANRGADLSGAFAIRDTTAGADRLIITSAGLVAINTTTPLANNRLHVEQNANANYSTSFAPGTTPSQLVLRDISDVATYTNPFAAVQFGAGNTGAGFSYIAGAREGAGLSFLAFGTGTGGQASERMRITSAGNVLIGQTASRGTVSAKLQVDDSRISITAGGASGILGGIAPASSVSNSITIEADPDNVAASSFVSFNVDAIERARITSAGNVGIGTTTPVNALQVNGSFGRNAPVTKAASFTLAATENWLICNGTATITVTLPAASSWTGREVMIKTIAAFTVVSASSNVVPLVGGAAGTAILAATAGKFATLVSDGTNWIIMQGN